MSEQIVPSDLTANELARVSWSPTGVVGVQIGRMHLSLTSCEAFLFGVALTEAAELAAGVAKKRAS